MSSRTFVKRNGAARRVLDWYVQWIPSWVQAESCSWDYCVAQFPSDSMFHLVLYAQDYDGTLYEHILSSHKTLTEAMNICKVLLANGGVHRH